MYSHDDPQDPIAEVLVYLASVYFNYDLPAQAIPAYKLVLRDLDPKLLMVAAQDISSRSKFFPTPAELRQTAFSLQTRANGVPDAYEAWAQVKGRFQGRREPLHPLAQRVIDQLGGLHAFGQSQISEEASWRARFIDAYNQQLRAEEETVKMLPQVRSLVESMSRERKLEDREEEDEEAQKR